MWLNWQSLWWPLRFSVTWLQIISSLKGGIVKSNEWSTHEYGQEPSITLTTAGFECRLRQHWPWDFTTIASNKTRCLWYCSFLVQIVLGREILKNLHKGDALAAVWLKMGCPLKVLVSGRFCLLFIHKICSLNAGACLIYRAPKSYHIMPLLRELHCLSVCYRFEYKYCSIHLKFAKRFKKFAKSFSDGMFQTEIRVPFHQSHLWYQIQAFVVVSRETELIWTNGNFAYHLPKPSTDRFAYLNGKRNNRSLKQRLCHSRFVLLT